MRSEKAAREFVKSEAPERKAVKAAALLFPQNVALQDDTLLHAGALFSLLCFDGEILHQYF
jgi:hypothetical protein